jgi:DNA repair exonuclease SbcCD ATPase subunit
MQLTENTVDGWSGVLTDLAAKRQAARDRTERLRTQKQELALEAAMGGTDAKKRLKEINGELAKADLEAADWTSAIAQAEQSKRQAERAEAETADRVRHEQIAAHLEAYLKDVREIDAGLAALVEHFQSAKQSLDAAEALMVGSEGTPIQQLRSAFGPTLAAAHAGLGKFIELGASAGHIQHRQPLERFAGRSPTAG